MDVLSPKSLFYLEHRDQIDTWANLESKAGEELHEWLCSWAEAMREEGSGEGRELFQRTEESRSPKLLWYRDEWRVDLDSPGAQTILDDAKESTSHVGIGVEWQKRSPHQKRGLYLGIWVNRRVGSDGNESLQERIQQDVEGHLEATKSRKWWPYYQNLDPLGRYISERMGVQEAVDDPDRLDTVLGEYQQEQLQALEELWDRCADLIDDAVREHT